VPRRRFSRRSNPSSFDHHVSAGKSHRRHGHTKPLSPPKPARNNRQFCLCRFPGPATWPTQTMRYAASASAFWAGFLNEPARSNAGCASRASRTIGPWRVARIQLKMLLRPEDAHPYGSTRGGRMGSKLTRPLPAPATRFRTTPTRPRASARRRRTRSPVGPQGPGLRFSRGHRYDRCRAPQVEPEPA